MRPFEVTKKKKQGKLSAFRGLKKIECSETIAQKNAFESVKRFLRLSYVYKADQ